MAGHLTADVSESVPAPVWLQQLRDQGFELAVEGDRLRIRPADRVTPELRAALAQRKDELLALLAPGEEYLMLRDGLALPLPALRLMWNLEERGFGFDISLDTSEQVIVEPAAVLTERDRVALYRWRRHVAAIVNYVNEVIG